MGARVPKINRVNFWNRKIPFVYSWGPVAGQAVKLIKPN